MNLKKSLLIALLSFGVAQSALAETNSEKLDRATQLYKQQNYSAAFPLLKQLGEKGNAKAQAVLGTMYMFGQGITQNSQQAVYWYTKAAEQGAAKAQSMLGFMYTNGLGVTQNSQQAVYWFTKAAEQGAAEVQLYLGVMYANGQGVAQNYQQAVYWF
ncbi:sel1 repeat family protein, partial [Histophilus somni]